MTLKDNNSRITDQAWNKLYDRLDQDGLLPYGEPPKRIGFRMTPLKWVAGLAVLCIGLAFAMISRSSKPEPYVNLVTLNNQNASSTLVSTLEDGSIVYLSESASLEFPNRFAEDKREVALSGDAYFDISRDQKKPFIIDTKDATIQVLGTAFDVKSRDKGSFSISVKHGEVKVTAKKGGQYVFVKAGQTAMLQADNLRTVQTSDAEHFAKYFNSIHFKDQRLEDIARIINMNSDSVHIEVSPQVKARLITMSFSGETLTEMVRYICLALNLESVRQQNKIIITNPK